MTPNSPLHLCLIKIRFHQSLNHDTSHWKSIGNKQTELSQQANKLKKIKKRFRFVKKGDFFSIQKDRFSTKCFNKENKAKVNFMWKWTLKDVLFNLSFQSIKKKNKARPYQLHRNRNFSVGFYNLSTNGLHRQR